MSFFFAPADYRKILQDLLLPDEIYDSVEDINLDRLFESGYTTVFLDVDNTLLTYEEREVNLQRVSWLERLKAKGFKIILISNNRSKRRIERVAKQLQLPALYFVLKPSALSIRECAEDQVIDLKKSIFIGDQLFKDVAVGNWLRAYTIWVNPIDIRQSFFKTVQRDLELGLLKKLS